MLSPGLRAVLQYGRRVAASPWAVGAAVLPQQPLPAPLLALSIGKRLRSLLPRRVWRPPRQPPAAPADVAPTPAHALTILNAMGDAVITTDIRGRVAYLNPVAERYTGWLLHEARGLPLGRVFQVIHEQHRTPIPDPVNLCLSQGRSIRMAGDYLLLSRSGGEYAIRDSVAPMRDHRGCFLGVVVVFQNVTRERRVHRERAYQASHDRLTGLANRQAFEQRLERVLGNARAGSGEHALCYLDLDRFKVVNDSCGHAAGDELLRQLGQLLRQVTRKRDTLARLGGDEFGLLLEHCALSQAERTANAICEAVQQFRFHWEHQTFRVGVSIGLVPINPESGDAQALMHQADLACFRAKDAGRDRIHLHRPDMEPVSGSPASHWAARIKLALAENRFQLYCQEAVALQPGGPQQPRLLEVMLRLREGSEVIGPGAFLPAAERYRLSPRLDRWVLDTLLGRLQAAAPDRGMLWLVNLSAQSLGDPALLKTLDRLLAHGGLPPEQLGFEISETAAVSQLACATRLSSELKARGCRVVLDNFGSGLSSFGYLKTLSVDYLKLDPALSREVSGDPTQRAIVRAIAEVARVMAIPSIATGVEDRQTLDELAGLGVDYAQGFYLGHPRAFTEKLDSTDPAGAAPASLDYQR